MGKPWVLQIRSEPPGWRLAVGALGVCAEEVVRPQGWIDELTGALEPLLGPVAWPVLLSVADVDWCDYEREVSSALAAVLADPSAQRALAQAPAHADALVVDVQEVALHAWPWELLALTPREAALPCLGVPVVRLLPAGREVVGAPREGRWRVAVWAGDESQEVTRLTAHLAGLAQAHGYDAAARCERDPTEEPGPRLLVWVVHGTGTTLQGRRALAHATATHASAAWVRWADVVLLLSCHAAQQESERDSLPAALVVGGARCVLAPRHGLSVVAAEATLAGLMRSLACGGTVGEAISAALREVRGLAGSLPEDRWWNLRAWVGDVDVLSLAGSPTDGAGRGPTPAALLAAGRELATRARHPFVGVEHVLLALGTHEPVVALAELHRLVRAATPELQRRLGSYPSAPAPVETAAYTALQAAEAAPMERWAALLSELCAALWRTLSQPLLFTPASGTEDSWATLPHAPDRRPVVAWRVVGGPEDGRTLPCDGGVLGHWWPGSVAGEHGLYASAGRRQDRQLSRRHAALLPGGRLLLHEPAFMHLSFEQPPRPLVRGEIPVLSGDLVGLTGLTWLLALGAA